MYSLKIDNPVPLRHIGRYKQSNGWAHAGRIMPMNILICIEEGSCVVEFAHTTVALNPEECIIIPHDVYYKPHAAQGCVFKAFHFSGDLQPIDEGSPVALNSSYTADGMPLLTLPEKFKTDSSIDLYLENALNERGNPAPGNKLKMNLHFLYALTRISENAAEIGISSVAQKIKAYIDKHLERKLTVSELSREFSYSTQHIIRLFRTSFHVTPSKYIIEARLAKSIVFLSESDLSIREIAERCGFKDLNYFSRQFKRSHHMSPTAYRKKFLERL